MNDHNALTGTYNYPVAIRSCGAHGVALEKAEKAAFWGRDLLQELTAALGVFGPDDFPLMNDRRYRGVAHIIPQGQDFINWKEARAFRCRLHRNTDPVHAGLSSAYFETIHEIRGQAPQISSFNISLNYNPMKDEHGELKGWRATKIDMDGESHTLTLTNDELRTEFLGWIRRYVGPDRELTNKLVKQVQRAQITKQQQAALPAPDEHPTIIDATANPPRPSIAS